MHSGIDNFIYLSTGVGLGGGIVLKGDLHQGYAGFGGRNWAYGDLWP